MTPTCEAVLCCSSDAGKRCRRPCIGHHDGRRVCWVHRSAAENRHRSEPVVFVEQAKRGHLRRAAS